MSLVVTDAILLHGFDYLESSRILRVVTRDVGVRSVLARGARRSQRRFGTSLDLYVQGTADLHMKIGRDLDTLSAFDVVRARPQLAEQLSRFSGASVIAELTLRFASEGADTGLFDTVEWALDAIGAASPERARDLTLCGAWRVLAELGVAPTIDQCAECRATIPPEDSPMFNHPSGGVICRRCRPLAGNGRAVPASARDVLRDWLSGVPRELASAQEGRAHQRLLHEFVVEHLAGDQPLRAFDAWERDQLTGVQASGKGAA